jgi:hypothetical protein
MTVFDESQTMGIILSVAETEALRNFLMRVGYISYETDWLIVELVHRLDNYLSERESLGSHMLGRD